MAFDFNAAREIVEAAIKRGAIRSQGEDAPPSPPQPEQKPRPAGSAVIPDWLQESILEPTPPQGFTPQDDRPERRSFTP
jgi:hypothetical protein